MKKQIKNTQDLAVIEEALFAQEMARIEAAKKATERPTEATKTVAEAPTPPKTKKATEKAIKKANKTKKVKKADRNQWGLTPKQDQFLRLMPGDNFWERGLDSRLWIDDFLDGISTEFNKMAAGAMISTLRERGLLAVGCKDDTKPNKDKYLQLTEEGKRIAGEMGIQ